MDFAFGFTTYASDINEANVDTLAKAYNTNIEVYTYAEFLNGRLIFSQREIEGTKESRYSLFETENKLVVSAIKKAEDNEGYIIRQKRQVEQYRKMEKKLIPDNLNYDEVPSLRLEARQKLKEFRPISVGQASRISGVSPADISVLLVYLEHYNVKNHS